MSMYKDYSDERKHLQSIGHLPEWFTTSGWILFKQKYAVAGEDAFYGRAKTIAKTAARHSPDPVYWEAKFFEAIWNGWLSCSTPILSNAGTTRGLVVSCSGQLIGDSIHDFYNTLHNAAMLSKMGFGTSGYLGKIRPRGAKISTGGKSQGVLPVYEDFVTMASKVSQGGTRRGSWAGYLPMMHPDFQEVYDFVYDKPDEVNVGWNWYDSDTKNVEAGDEETLKRFKKVMKLRAVQGKGYIFFPDKANRLAPQMYKDLGLNIESSNLCLTGDTMIEVSKYPDGKNPISYRLDHFCEMFSFGAMQNMYTKSWDGENVIWCKISNAGQTGVASELIEIESENGNVIRCTPDHQILTKNRGWVRAADLEETDELIE